MIDALTLAALALAGCLAGLVVMIALGGPSERPPGPWRKP